MIIKQGFSLKGFDGLAEKLKVLPQRVENNVLQSAATGALRDVLPEMRAAAPRDVDDQSPASKKYGRLRRNIRVIRLKRKRRGWRAARIDTGNAFWALFYELGTRYQSARPFFANKFRQLRELILQSAGKRLGAGIEREAMRK